MEPVPQGSVKAFARPNGSIAVMADNKAKLRTYRDAVGNAARAAGIRPSSGALGLSVTFNLKRPKSRPKRDKHPDKKPDIDKLLRAVMDALTGVAYNDDAQVCQVSMSKQWHTEGHISVEVEVYALEEPVEQAAQEATSSL